VRTPEDAYERQWASRCWMRCIGDWNESIASMVRAALFEALRPALAGRSESQPYAELARGLAMSEGAVRTAVHRLRQRYRESSVPPLPKRCATPAK